MASVTLLNGRVNTTDNTNASATTPTKIKFPKRAAFLSSTSSVAAMASLEILVSITPTMAPEESLVSIMGVVISM